MRSSGRVPALTRRRFLLGAAGSAAATVPLLGTPDAVATTADDPSLWMESTVLVQDTDPGISYRGSWSQYANRDPAYWHGSHATSSRVAESTFEYVHPDCTQLRWRSTKAPNRGVARVYVDGQKVATVDTYAPQLTASAVVWDSGPVPAGKHVLTVEVTNTKSKASSDTWVECNAVEAVGHSIDVHAVDDTDPSMVFDTNWQSYLGLVGRSNGTAHRTRGTVGATMLYAHPRCSQLSIYGSVGPDCGQAEVYVDGVASGWIDAYATKPVPGALLYRSPSLTTGRHTISVFTRGSKQQAASDSWIEVDQVVVTGDLGAIPLDCIPATSRLVQRQSASNTSWQVGYGTQLVGGSALLTSDTGAKAVLTFTGDTIVVIGGRTPNGGLAEIWLDGVLEATVDAYAPTPQFGQELYRKFGLAPDTTHLIQVVSLGIRNGVSDKDLYLEAFECTKAIDIVATVTAQGLAEKDVIRAGKRPYLASADWTPVTYAASAPDSGVRMLGVGPLATCFQRNTEYLKWSFSLKATNYVSAETYWNQRWPASNEGRLLAGAAHSLRWLDPGIGYTDMQNIVADMVGKAKSRQGPSGYCLPYDLDVITPPSGDKDRERPNYDRAMWTRGMVAAIQAGNTDARVVLRKFYDWFNTGWGDANLGYLIGDSLGCQGHIGSTLVYHSPIGTPRDLEVADRFFTQDWLVEQLRQREPAAISNYPLNRPHSYLIIALEAYLDHFRATGARKYLDAALGGWDIFSRYFSYNGNGTSITETIGSYFPAGSARLDGVNNEGCGSVFWIDLNHRLHQLYPDQEKYVAEIERYLFNVCLAQQGGVAPYGIRYHAMYEGLKEAATTKNTCDEVVEAGLYGRLPQYIYSIANDGGLWVNLYESSRITWNGATLTTTTTFPESPTVLHQLSLIAQTSMTIRVRVPAWATSTMPISVNGTIAGNGKPGTYVAIQRTWRDGDKITYTLPIGFTTLRYTGLTQFAGRQRHALQYGPVLMGLTGDWTDSPYVQSNMTPTSPPVSVRVPALAIAPAALAGSLTQIAALHWQVKNTDHVYKPYWQIQRETFSCYPILMT